MERGEQMEDSVKRMREEGFLGSERRDPKRIPSVLDVLRQHWERHPDLRLGQIMANLSYQTQGRFDPYHLDDGVLFDALLAALKDDGGS